MWMRRVKRSRAEAATGGTNVVNTILVDFRAMDTLGEAVVLGAVALRPQALGRFVAPGRGLGSRPSAPER